MISDRYMFQNGEERKIADQSIDIMTGAHPSHISICQFKENIKKYLKKGYHCSGVLVVDEKGGLTQKLVKKK